MQKFLENKKTLVPFARDENERASENADLSHDCVDLASSNTWLLIRLV